MNSDKKRQRGNSKERDPTWDAPIRNVKDGKLDAELAEEENLKNEQHNRVRFLSYGV